MAYNLKDSSTINTEIENDEIKLNVDISKLPQGPKGDKGDKGDTGPQGLQGIPGIDGSTPIIDNLSSTSTTSALSANQGKILNETKLSSVPNASSTVVGGIKIRVDSVNNAIYITTDGSNP